MSFKIAAELDLREAINKTAQLKALRAAAKKLAQGWAADTVKLLRASGLAQKKSGAGTKHMGRNVASETTVGDKGYTIKLGTGLAGMNPVKYADIQDKGGTIKARDKKLTIPFPGVKGTMRSNFGGKKVIWIKSKKGNTIACEKIGKGDSASLRALFTLVDEVEIPASNWFSGPLEKQLPQLDLLMSEQSVLEQAARMREKAG
jgi:hypothetical protein